MRKRSNSIQFYFLWFMFIFYLIIVCAMHYYHIDSLPTTLICCVWNTILTYEFTYTHSTYTHARNIMPNTISKNHLPSPSEWLILYKPSMIITHVLSCIKIQVPTCIRNNNFHFYYHKELFWREIAQITPYSFIYNKSWTLIFNISNFIIVDSFHLSLLFSFGNLL